MDGEAPSEEMRNVFACEHMGAGCRFVSHNHAEVVAHELRCPFSPGQSDPRVRGIARTASADRREQRAATARASEAAEVGVPPDLVSAKLPTPRRSRDPKTPPRRSPRTPSASPANAQDPSSGKRQSTRRREEVTVQLTGENKNGVGLEALWPNETLAVFNEKRLGIVWVSYTKDHVLDHLHVVVERLEDDAEEARTQRIRPGSHLVRIGDKFSSEYSFSEALEAIKEAPRPLRLVLAQNATPVPTQPERPQPDCVAWNLGESAAVLDGTWRPGMALATVNGVSVRGKRLEQVKQDISAAERPVRLTFRERRAKTSRSSSARKKTPARSRGKTPPRPLPPEGLPPPTPSSGVATLTPSSGVATLVPEVHKVLWEGWLHLLPDRRRHWFFMYQVDREQCCRIAYKEDTGVERANDNDSDGRPPTSMLSDEWKDLSPLVQVRVDKPGEPEHFVLRTRDHGEYYLSAGDEYVAQTVINTLRGNELPGHVDIQSERPPIIDPIGPPEIGTEGTVFFEPPVDPIISGPAKDLDQRIVWVAAAVLVLFCSVCVGTWAGLVRYGGAAQTVVEEPSCVADTACGPHGVVQVFSSPAERDQQLGRLSVERSAAGVERGGVDAGSVCACVCDEGWSGEDCTTVPLGLLETVWREFSGTVSGMHSRLHEQLALVASGTDDGSVAAPEGEVGGG